ncbi:MAG: S9 family peptidase [Bacteroidales bacterium]|nr:S9 family peptidase [Bacteroidales bacterium]
MKKKSYLSLALNGLFLGMFLLTWSCSTKKTVEVEPPVAEKISKELVAHNDTRVDDYFWMRLSDEQKNDENPDEQTNKVIDYLNAENAYKDKMLEHTVPFQESLFDEIVGRIKQDDESVPYKENGYFYYSRYEEGQEYPIYCRKKGNLDAEEEIILNVNILAEGYDYYQIAGMSISEDNKLLAYGVDTVSRRRYTIYFMSLETGKLLSDVIPNTTGRVTWANDNKTVLFSTKDEQTLRSDRINLYKLGDKAPQEVYYEQDETFNTYVYKTKSKKFLVIASSQTLSSEYRILEANNPTGTFRIFQAREKDLEYDIDHYGSDFYVRTNIDGAKNFKLMKTPITKTTKDNWVDVIPHRDDVLFQSFEIFKNFFVISERIRGLTNLRVMNWKDVDYYLDFGEETYSARFSINPEFNTDILRYGYSSLTTPYSTFDYNMVTKEKTLLKEEEVLGDFDKTNYESKRLYAMADDGVEVPISIVYKKGIILDGTNPALIYGYGSYGASMDASFRSDRLSLLDRGFIYAIAHIRGGMEMGRWWYEDGKLLKKINTFTDFNTCAQYLVDKNYTDTDKLFALGGSAGGLLVGAIVNMRPDLYKGIVAAVPFVDVVSTMQDASIPLTTGEWDEWGNPEIEEYYDYMLSYSPYDNVQEMNYPNILVTTGYWDSQVQYWEPAKWVARLRDLKTDDKLLLLKTNMEAGHGGASGRFEYLKEVAFEYSFLLKLAGKTP